MEGSSISERRDQLVRVVEHDREALQQALRSLRERTRERLDVAEQIRRRPAPWLVGAFAFGLLLGLRKRD